MRGGRSLFESIPREVLLLGLARMADSLGGSMLIVLLPLLVEHHQIGVQDLSTPLVIGVLLSAYGICSSLFQPTVGVLIDRWEARVVFVLVGLLVYAGATLLFIWVRSFPGLLVLRVVQGLGVALTIPPSLALITEYTEPANRGTSMSIYNVMRLVGFSLGPLLAGYLVTRTGFSLLFFLGALTNVIGAVLVNRLVREPELPRGEGSPPTLSRAYGSFLSSEMSDFLKLAFANASMAASISLIATLENQFNARLNQTPGDFGVAFSSLVFALMVFQVPLGRLSDRIGRKTLIVCGLLLLVPVTLWMGYLRTTLQFVTARVLQGVAVAAVAAPSFALGGDKSRSEQRGRELSVLTMAFGLGIGIGPFLSGWLAGQIAFEAPFWTGAFLTLLSAGLVTWGVEEKHLED